MSNDLVINASQEGVRIALLKDKKIVEYHIEEEGSQFSVGDVYLGVIRKLVPGMNAAFVDIGFQKDAFLHYQDLGSQIIPLLKYTKDSIAKRQMSSKLDTYQLGDVTDKFGGIEQVLNRNIPILVQILKEPISTKGPRLTCEISLAGRYMVLVPFSETVSVSKKISSREEKQRLSRLIQSIKPKNFGVIVRTAAEGVEVAELDADLRGLLLQWEEGFQLLREALPKTKLIGELSRVSAILRDMFNEDFDSIVVDDKTLYEEVKGYVKKIAPKQEKIVRLHSQKNKIFEALGIEKQLKSLFGKSVNLPSGGYLIIEHTEALHVIDVNSGNKSVSEDNQEDTALSVNLEAVEEIARQLRVRDMGGIVVVDFIDMRKAENKRLVYQKMKETMKGDRSQHNILPLTRFGLMQITRERVRPQVNIKTLEDCPACGGTGKITPSILISDIIEQNLDYIIGKQNEKSVSLIVHPFLHSHFTKGFLSRQMRWFFKYKKWIKIIKDSSLGINTFHFKDKDDELIEII